MMKQMNTRCSGESAGERNPRADPASKTAHGNSRKLSMGLGVIAVLLLSTTAHAAQDGKRFGIFRRAPKSSPKPKPFSSIKFRKKTKYLSDDEQEILREMTNPLMVHDIFVAKAFTEPEGNLDQCLVGQFLDKEHNVKRSYNDHVRMFDENEENFQEEGDSANFSRKMKDRLKDHFEDFQFNLVFFGDHIGLECSDAGIKESHLSDARYEYTTTWKPATGSKYNSYDLQLELYTGSWNNGDVKTKLREWKVYGGKKQRVDIYMQFDKMYESDRELAQDILTKLNKTLGYRQSDERDGALSGAIATSIEDFRLIPNHFKAGSSPAQTFPRSTRSSISSPSPKKQSNPQAVELSAIPPARGSGTPVAAPLDHGAQAKSDGVSERVAAESR